MNDIILMIIICMFLGYAVGCINLSFILAKRKGYDIREHGSGNAGASNLFITMGKWIGLLVAFIDIFKAFAVVKFAMFIYSDSILAGFVCATFVVLGNIFPFYMGFRGGKGFASIGGTALALDLKIFLVLFVITLVIVFISDFICFGPMFASIAFPLTYGLVHTTVIPSVYILASMAVLYRHKENIERIRQGKELKFSFLWNRKKEAERLGFENYDGKTYPFEQDVKRKV